MYKEDLINEIVKLEDELNAADKKTYIVNTRINRLIIFLKGYNREAECNELEELIKELDSCGSMGIYGTGGVFDKDRYLDLLKGIKGILERT